MHRFFSWLRPVPPAISAPQPHATKAMIELKDLIKIYETPAGPFTALNSIDLKIRAGEFVAIIGKSGSGKSTLINTITGIDRPSHGTITVAGTTLNDLTERQISRWRGLKIGVIFQFFQLLPTLSLLENVMLPMEFCQRFTPKERLARGIDLLKQVDLEDQAHKLPSEVSGGQQQRAAIARALANDPDIIVADEPTGSLDSKTGEAIFQLFEQFVASGRTVLMVTHDRSLASRVSRVLYISDGMLVDEILRQALPGLTQGLEVNLLSNLDAAKYQPGEIIIHQGDPSDKFYMITKGQVEVFTTLDAKAEINLGYLKQGQYFGEIGVLSGKPRQSSVRACGSEEVSVMQLSKEAFVNIMDQSNLTKKEVIRVITTRLIRNDLIHEMPNMSATISDLLSQNLVAKRYLPGKAIVREGEHATSFFVITEGGAEVSVQHFLKGASPTERIIDYLETGQFFGEMGIDDGDTVKTSVIADREIGATVIAIDKTLFIKLRQDESLSTAQKAKLVHDRILGISTPSFDPTPQIVALLESVKP